jgi:hypothetical protein
VESILEGTHQGHPALGMSLSLKVECSSTAFSRVYLTLYFKGSYEGLIYVIAGVLIVSINKGRRLAYIPSWRT